MSNPQQESKPQPLFYPARRDRLPSTEELAALAALIHPESNLNRQMRVTRAFELWQEADRFLSEKRNELKAVEAREPAPLP